MDKIILVTHFLTFLLGLVTVSLIYRLWKAHAAYVEIIHEANHLLESMRRHEHKLNIMVYNCERRLDALFDKEKRSDDESDLKEV